MKIAFRKTGLVPYDSNEILKHLKHNSIQSATPEPNFYGNTNTDTDFEHLPTTQTPYTIRTLRQQNERLQNIDPVSRW